jgi:tripartite-type tricarboxylate transporter receptor subunit TctC
MITGRVKRGKIFIALCFLGLISVLLVGRTVDAAEDYPRRPINIWVGNPPGAGAGNTGMIFAEGAKKYLPRPQPILMNYKPGAAQALATEYVLNQPRDGYNLLWLSQDIVAKMAMDADQLHFSRKDLIFIGLIATAPSLLVVNKEKSPFKTFEEFLNYAKKNPDKLSYGSSGVGSGVHLNGEILQLRCGIKLNHIPFAGGAGYTTAILGGHLDCVVGNIGNVAEHMTAGLLRGLAVFAKERIAEFPEIPTIFEKGYKVDRGVWYFLVAGKDTPQPVVDILREVFRKTADDPQVKAAITKLRFIPLNLGAEETEKKFNTEFDESVEVLRKPGKSK